MVGHILHRQPLRQSKRQWLDIEVTRWPAGRAFDLETAQHFPGIDASKFRFWGDPAGDSRAQTDEDTPFKILRAAGIKADPAPTNDIDIRIEVVSNALNRLIDGQPGLIVDPRCITIHKGFVSGYRYRRMQITGIDKYDVVPDKNRFSHPHDSLQYMLLGGGEGRQLVRGATPTRSTVAAREWDVFARRPRSLRS